MLIDRIPLFHERAFLGSILPFNVLSFYSKNILVTRLQNINYVHFITVLADTLFVLHRNFQKNKNDINHSLHTFSNNYCSLETEISLISSCKFELRTIETFKDKHF